MKKLIEIFIVVSILFLVIYISLYLFYFDSLCKSFSWESETDITYAYTKLAYCKDSFICDSIDIETNYRNEITDWSCEKKDSPLFGKDLYIDIFNHLKNSIIK